MYDNYRYKLYQEADIIDLDKRRKAKMVEDKAAALVNNIKKKIAAVKKSSMKTNKEIAAIRKVLLAAKADLSRARSYTITIPRPLQKRSFPFGLLAATIVALLIAAKVAHATSRNASDKRFQKSRVAKATKQRIKESIMENEDFLSHLYMDQRTDAREWQGPNIPYGDDSNRPNLIRKCTMMESDQQKINCLRKLRDQAAMNPFYQHRIDRYIDEITDTYEPTNKPGTIPGNEFKASGVGDDTKIEPVQEQKVDTKGIDHNPYGDLRTWDVDDARAFCKKWARRGGIKDPKMISKRYDGCLEHKLG